MRLRLLRLVPPLNLDRPPVHHLDRQRPDHLDLGRHLVAPDYLPVAVRIAADRILVVVVRIAVAGRILVVKAVVHMSLGHSYLIADHRVPVAVRSRMNLAGHDMTLGSDTRLADSAVVRTGLDRSLGPVGHSRLDRMGPTCLIESK